MKLSNKLYDILKWGLIIFIPTVITLIDWSANLSDGSLYTNNATWHEFSTTYMID